MELWSLIFIHLDYPSLSAARLASREADHLIYRNITFKRWNNARMLAMLEGLTRTGRPRRASAVHSIVISSVETRVESRAVDALKSILQISRNLKILVLPIFTRTGGTQNATELCRLLELFEAPPTFRLCSFTTDAPFGHDAIQFLGQQRNLNYLEWDGEEARNGPRKNIPSDVLYNLRYLHSISGFQPFASAARHITHLSIEMQPLRAMCSITPPAFTSSYHPEMEEVLDVLSDHLVSLKIVERRVEEATRPIRLATFFKGGVPPNLKYLELRECPSTHRALEFARHTNSPPTPTPTLGSPRLHIRSAEGTPFIKANALDTFVLQAAWMYPVDNHSREIRHFAEMISRACPSLHYFAALQDDLSRIEVYELEDGKTVACEAKRKPWPCSRYWADVR